MREVGGKEYFEALMAAFDKYKNEHIAVYGPDNHLRLTGLHETQSIDKFNYGVANRGASVRVPHSFVNNGYKGYLEDRRPNSQGDPYKIASRILQTIATVPFVGIFQPAPGGQTEADAGNLQAGPCQPLREITAGGIAFHVRAEGDDDFLDRFAHQSFFQIRDPQVVRLNAVER
jgi:hypothetical protein